MHRLLGQIEITEEADERCEDAAGVVAVNRLYRNPYVSILAGGQLRALAEIDDRSDLDGPRAH